MDMNIEMNIEMDMDIKMKCVSELFELSDILDEIVPDSSVSYFNEDDSLELYDTFIHLMEHLIEQNPTLITEEDFADIFDDYINDILDVYAFHFNEDIFYNDDAEEELELIMEQAREDFFKDHITPRSFETSCILPINDNNNNNDHNDHKDNIAQQLIYLKSKPQPDQRTPEWYQMRHNLITASNAYKAFESQNVQNSLIYEKCQPLKGANVDEDTKSIYMVNTTSTLHWGQKYEPLSVIIYENMYNTKIDDFGCIQHDVYKFLGASPDGINVKIDSDRYGRMLEIKNVVSREITGIPKKEYWIQMQLQMEVCDLDECDFLETKFVEYDNAQDYWNDIGVTEKKRGIMMHFHTKTGAPFYKNIPFDISGDKALSDKCIVENIELYQGPEYGYVWIKNNYWKLDFYSCVLVLRNREWFKTNIQGLQNIWDIILKERVTGYEHRAPKKKNVVSSSNNGVQTLLAPLPVQSNISKPYGCKLILNKLNNQSTDNKMDDNK